MRIVASRGSMDLGESDGGLPPDSLVEDIDTILADTERLARARRRRDGADRRRALLAVLGHDAPDGGVGRARAPARAAAAHAPRRDGRGGGLLPRALRLHAGRVPRARRLARRRRLVRALRPPLATETSRRSAARASASRTARPRTCGSAPASRRSARCSTRDVRVGLGVDGSASNERSDLFVEVKQALLVARGRGGAGGADRARGAAARHARRRRRAAPRRHRLARAGQARRLRGLAHRRARVRRRRRPRREPRAQRARTASTGCSSAATTSSAAARSCAPTSRRSPASTATRREGCGGNDASPPMSSTPSAAARPPASASSSARDGIARRRRRDRRRRPDPASSPTPSPGTYRIVFHPPSPFFRRVELEVELGDGPPPRPAARLLVRVRELPRQLTVERAGGALRGPHALRRAARRARGPARPRARGRARRSPTTRRRRCSTRIPRSAAQTALGALGRASREPTTTRPCSPSSPS